MVPVFWVRVSSQEAALCRTKIFTLALVSQSVSQSVRQQVALLSVSSAAAARHNPVLTRREHKNVFLGGAHETVEPP